LRVPTLRNMMPERFARCPRAQEKKEVVRHAECSPMIHELPEDIHRIEVPLPRNPLRVINAYVVRGRDRCLMIDTGMNRPESIEAMRAGIKRLALDLDRMDLFITHGHSDHVGLVSELKTGGCKIFLHPADAAIVLDPHLWSNLARSAHMHGFPDADTAVGKHPGKKYLFDGRPEFTSLREGDTLSVGRYRFRCVETPGHTPGHLCLYEPDARIFFSGDHLLDSITPNISGWAQENEDPLGDFLASLDKVAAYDVRLVLPGHRNPITDHRRRIEELKAHHRVRAQEITGILGRCAQTAYQVASQMTWDLSYSRWADFPVPQQWFATGEALAHLLYLERKGEIARRRGDGTVLFSL
jgi:glyoxylase-like metal-dependent hydrolase (beta-lactamase superfamily II)